MSSNKNIDTMTAIVRTLIATNGPKAFTAALNNACFHGEVFDACNGVEEHSIAPNLGLWYDGIETMTKAAQQMETN